MIAHVGGFDRQVRGEGMLQIQGPVPYVGCGETTIHGHDRTRTVEAIHRASAVKRPVRSVPSNRVICDVLVSDVTGFNCAPGCISGSVDRSSRRNTAGTESIVERDE